MNQRQGWHWSDSSPIKNGDHFHNACLPVKRLWMKDLMSPERVDLDNIGVHKQSGRGDYWGNRNKEQVRARPLTAEYQTRPHFKTEQLVAAKLCNRKNQNRSFQVLSETISQTGCFFPTDWDRQQLSRSRKTFKWWRHHLHQPASHVHDIFPQLFPVWSSCLQLWLLFYLDDQAVHCLIFTRFRWCLSC